MSEEIDLTPEDEEILDRVWEEESAPSNGLAAALRPADQAARVAGMLLNAGDEDGDEDDPEEKAGHIADILAHFLADDDLEDWADHYGEEGRQATAFRARQRLYAPDQPRDEKGRFAKGSGQSAEKAREIASQHRGRKMPAAKAKEFAGHLEKMTVKELHELKREHGIKASGNKAELVAKLKERIKDKLEKDKPAKAKKPMQTAEEAQRNALPDHGPSKLPIEHQGSTSPQFRERVDRALRTVPVNIRDHFARWGGSVQTGETVFQVRPDLKGLQPRGWSEGDYNRAGGLYDPNVKSALVTQKVVFPGGGAVKENVYPNAKDEGVLRHELGHGIDHSMGWFSSDQAFRDAYDKDSSAIRTSGREDEYAYLLQPGSRGREEAFAEVFAGIHGGGASLNPDFSKPWSNVRQLIKERTAKL